MLKAVILEQFDAGRECVNCNAVTVHELKKIDENGDGKFIGYYGECEVCKEVFKLSKGDFIRN
ncbi:hypothetical protein CN931_23935 [Bacillus sp. AFS054943]|uniref:Uncharacterized protein n=1 Tax=Bacillus cereus TaxID=1396 RepID=A0A2C1LQE8_BACCE|nr:MULTISPECIES: hypothetical protein [Bacillus]PGL78101.1 hypothetical protein CN931_23935 [Bacillus sp. AFS054943]PGT99870.1 hypothetical protein COD19_18135 [Bacillus cereus]